MQLSNTGSETPRSKPSEMAETNIVTQPAKLNELMEVINVMGAISEKIAEQRPMASSMQSDSSGSAKATAQSARDIAIANLPEAPVMQKNLISHIQKEIKTLEREVKLIAKERKLHPTIRVAQAKCLGQCAKGVNIMVYPENTWHSDVRLEDVPSLAAQYIQP